MNPETSYAACASWGDAEMMKLLQAQFSAGESIAVSRKKVLLRLLAMREAERLGIAASADAGHAGIASLEQRFAENGADSMDRWLKRSELRAEELRALFQEIAVVGLVEAHFSREIDRGMGAQRKLQTLYRWLGGEHQDAGAWIQMNVQLARAADGGAPESAVRVFEELLPLVRPSARPAGLTRFFATRKPPDLRLRLQGRDIEREAAALGQRLDELRRTGAVALWYATPYEPETARFGGWAILEVVHRFFEADTLGWMAWESLARAGRNRLSREVFSLAALDDLFHSNLCDGAEVWDVWNTLGRQHGFSGHPREASAPRSSPMMRQELEIPLSTRLQSDLGSAQPEPSEAEGSLQPERSETESRAPRLQARGPALGVIGIPSSGATSARALEPATPSEIQQLSSAEESELLGVYAVASREVAKGLAQVARDGELRVGTRALLATLALFHWNRFGMGLESRRRIIDERVAGADPNASLE